MNTEIQLTKNMSVYATDDAKIGDIKHVVVDPVTSKTTHVVIEQGLIFTTDKVLPLEYIARQEDGALYLDRSSNALDLPNYEDTYYVNRHNEEVVAENDIAPNTAVAPRSVYYYPPLLHGGAGIYDWGLPAYLEGDPLRAVTQKNIPEDSVVIEEGMNVYSLDDDHVGDVHSVHVDKVNNRITHFIISQGLLFKDYKLIPVFWVNQVTDEGIRVAVETEQLEKLPAHEPETA